MKKVGLLTFQNANNYGALLQAYALKETINKLGCDASVINYDSKDMHLKLVQKPVFYEFAIHYLNLQGDYSDAEDIDYSMYDLVIVGSDQVWNPEITYSDKAYFLDFLPSSIQRMSYAASIGIGGETIKQYADFFESGLKDFEKISIRESNQISFLEELTGKKIERHVDPTLLLNAEEYISGLEVPRCEQEFIFVYSNNINSKLLDFANLLSLHWDIPIRAVSNYGTPYFTNNSSSVTEVEIEKWLAQIKDAKIILTDSYHGLMFSLIFEKPFYIYTQNRANISRILEVLLHVGLEKRTIKNVEKITDVSVEIDFSRARKWVADERERSIEYLKRVTS